MRLDIGLMLALAIASSQIATADYDLSQHLWKDRLIVLIATDPDDPALQAQLSELKKRRAAVEDRDLRVLQLLPDTGRVDDEPLRIDDVRRLRNEFGAKIDTRGLLLIGKDGGVKRSAALDIDLSRVFAQIDGMPMRRSEMRQKRATGADVTRP